MKNDGSNIKPCMVFYYYYVSQGDVPWDDKDFRYILITLGGVASVLLYLYLRDPGREITWKDFVHRYLDRGLVRICGI